ncbi:MAG: hypothetical protein JSV77_10405 [Dehalococcoidales bacterium]|nr:MAG: hypothetical protein JSV77_10405 [Dehalococcoidales bacterium]
MSSPDSQAVMQLFDTKAAIKHLEKSIADGKEWYLALLEAIALWDCPKETHNGRTYRYLIADEALDWMLLAERLCEAVDSRLPEDEKLNFLFHGRLPVDITTKQFKQLVGSVRYHQYLNYFYGITVEEALFWAVQDEVRKERRVSGFAREQDPSNEVYRRVYRQGREVLLKSFRKENGYHHLKSTTLLEMKEFTYWLFKYRLKHSDKARIASDTKKGLDWLNANNLSGQPLKS